VCIQIKAVDRIHLLLDLVKCITGNLRLSISDLQTKTDDEIVTCTVHFAVHSAWELNNIIASINQVKNVDEVRRVELCAGS
jgi:GTP pyrophosphokinase